MTALHQQVRRTIRRHALCPPGSRVLVGVSGGSDSVALVHLLHDLAEHGEFTVVALAHLNHRLRASADRDEAFCRALGARLGLPLVIEAADVQAYARAHGLSIEDAARRVRYDFLERSADGYGADRIAVGHTQDDQAETVLLKLMRGAGLTGLAGIYPRRGRVIRPLLDVTRAELREFLGSKGEPWVEDETNLDVDNPRNRIRHRVLPELDRAAGGSTRAAIARAAALIREDGQWLDEVADRCFQRLATDTEDGLELDVSGLCEAPAPIRRRVLLRAMRQAAGAVRDSGPPSQHWPGRVASDPTRGEREIGQQHVEAVARLLARPPGERHGGVDVPGSRVELRGEKLVLMKYGGRGATEPPRHGQGLNR